MVSSSANISLLSHLRKESRAKRQEQARCARHAIHSRPKRRGIPRNLMNFLLLILLDISASDDDYPYLSIARRPLEALIADWVRQGEEINLLRDLVAGQTPRDILN